MEPLYCFACVDMLINKASGANKYSMLSVLGLNKKTLTIITCCTDFARGERLHSTSHSVHFDVLCRQYFEVCVVFT